MMHGSSCRLPKDVCGCSSTMRELACMWKRGKEVYPTQHQAWSFHVVSGLETVRHFSVQGCTMLSGSRRGQGAKCQGIWSDWSIAILFAMGQGGNQSAFVLCRMSIKCRPAREHAGQAGRGCASTIFQYLEHQTAFRKRLPSE
jgi:hypothetical protein